MGYSETDWPISSYEMSPTKTNKIVHQSNVNTVQQKCFEDQLEWTPWMPSNDSIIFILLFVIISFNKKDKQKNINMSFDTSKISGVTRVKQQK